MVDCFGFEDDRADDRCFYVDGSINSSAYANIRSTESEDSDAVLSDGGGDFRQNITKESCFKLCNSSYSGQNVSTICKHLRNLLYCQSWTRCF